MSGDISAEFQERPHQASGDAIFKRKEQGYLDSALPGAALVRICGANKAFTLKNQM